MAREIYRKIIELILRGGYTLSPVVRAARMRWTPARWASSPSSAGYRSSVSRE